MNKQTLALVVVAVVVFLVGLIGAIAFTGEDSSGGNVHTMPNGETMTEQMTTGADHTMPGGETMTGPMDGTTP